MKIIVKVQGNGVTGTVRRSKDREFTRKEAYALIDEAFTQIPGYTGVKPKQVK
jgi:hypothetical protein